MEKVGYIAVHRKILDNPIVFKDSDHVAVWLYLLLNATHRKYQALFKGVSIVLEPGQLITGRLSIANKLKIKESKVQRILNLLKSEQLIEQQTCNQNRLITLVSWGKYQKSEQRNEQRVNNERTTGEQRVNTNNNVNKGDNDNTPTKKRKPAANKIDDEFLAKMGECYPDIDIAAEKNKAEAWIASNPGRKMTRRFFNSWLSRAKPVVDPDDWYQLSPERIAEIIALEDEIAREEAEKNDKKSTGNVPF